MKSKVLLIPLSLLYKAVITIRHRLFDWGCFTVSISTFP